MSFLSPSLIALGRTGVGSAMLAAPEQVTPYLGGGSDTPPWIVQMLGAREVALGVGALTGRSKRWYAAGLVSDGVDAVVFAAGVRSGRISRTTGGAAVVVASVAALVQLRALASRG